MIITLLNNSTEFLSEDRVSDGQTGGSLGPMTLRGRQSGTNQRAAAATIATNQGWSGSSRAMEDWATPRTRRKRSNESVRDSSGIISVAILGETE